MARSLARGLLALASVGVLLQFAAPRAFLPTPPAGAWAGSAAAGSLATQLPDMDMQLLLSRIPGGPVTIMQNKYVATPTEEGLTDAQVGVCLVLALVGLVLAIELATKLAKFGEIEDLKYDPKKKGYITPLAKRIIEEGR